MHVVCPFNSAHGNPPKKNGLSQVFAPTAANVLGTVFDIFGWFPNVGDIPLKNLVWLRFPGDLLVV